ncbi:microcystin-dependent protein [Spirosoma lacussanchae]|uniref:phage tail protein n=1 Tax=Spirosoma lacussanchae TaxID=1884249 RepID=UPI001108D0FD|nr:tail fiber protein [Spirosoma lacussanchae]
MEGYVGEIKLFAGDYAPMNWAFCHGQMLSIRENQILYSITANLYGGDGRDTFALPDLRGRVPVGQGQGKDQNVNFALGAKQGAENVTLTDKQNGVAPVSVGNNTALATQTAVLTPTPAQPHNNRAPYLGLHYIICLRGYYPERD